MSTQVESITRRVERLSELTGIAFTFGYIGNLSGIEGTPACRDDRCWYVFAPHPGRVGTHKDSLGGFSTDQLDRFQPLLTGAIQLATIQKEAR